MPNEVRERKFLLLTSTQNAIEFLLSFRRHKKEMQKETTLKKINFSLGRNYRNIAKRA